MRSHQKMKDSEFERLLIRSARLDNQSAPPTVRRRVLAACHPFVGAAGAAGTLAASRALASVTPSTMAASVTASLKLLGPALIVKCTICGLLGGAAIAGAYRMAALPSVESRVPQIAAVASSMAQHAAPLSENRDRARAASTEVSLLELPTPVAVVSGNQAAAAAGSHVNAWGGAASSSSSAVTKRGAYALGAEVAMLDQARAALASGDGVRAIRVLDDYQKNFRSGNLLPEATYIRVQALLKTGNHAAARDMAAHAQARWPDSPVSKDLGALVRASTGP